jgi:dUTPase
VIPARWRYYTTRLCRNEILPRSGLNTSTASCWAIVGLIDGTTTDNMVSYLEPGVPFTISEPMERIAQLVIRFRWYGRYRFPLVSRFVASGVRAVLNSTFRQAVRRCN